MLVGKIFIGYSVNMSGYKLYMSNRLDSFINEYSHILKSNSLFGEKIYIVVQNKSIGEWLKLQIASQCGVSANLNIILPENAVRLFIHSFPLGRQLLASPKGDGDRAVLFMDNLKIIIYKKLEQLLHAEKRDIEFSKSLYNSLENYVKGLSSEDQDYEAVNSLRLYQLSDSIAGLFYYYGMNCRELTASWEDKKMFFPSSAGDSLKNHEKWQMALWNELFKDDSPYVHLSSILSSIVDKGDVFDGDSCRIVLFGSAFMGDSSLRFFNHLSLFVDVHHFILSPCEKREEFTMDLLKNWGSLFEGFNKLIDSPSFHKSGNIEKSFCINEQQTALSVLQNSLLNNENPRQPYMVLDSDESLRIISTTGKWREVEALKNRILKLLDEDESLALTDIGVLAPDINEYSHFIEAVFPATDMYNLPYNIIDLKGDEDSPYISAFLALINLAGSRFTRKEIFSLFSNRCFAERNNISSGEYDSWLQMCSSVNIKWAVDGEQKKELNVDGDRYNTWESGFDRILEGIALTEDEDPLSAPFELFNESSNVSAGKLIHILRSLDLDINALSGVKLQLEEWVLLWESIMETYLKPSEVHPVDTKDRLRLKGCFRDILNMLNDLNNLEDLKNRLFDFFMFKSLITEFINKSGGSRGRYLTQGISCSSLKPLRAVPFKVILVLGLNEEVFPVNEEPLSFDLKETSYVKDIISIDLSRISSDKYSFLEVFLSAREKVFLFYTGRNNIDNEALQPSPLISEFSEYLNKCFICSGDGNYFNSIFEEEKLQPFDKEYFDSESKLFSYNEKDFKLSEIYNNKEKGEERASAFDAIPMKQEEDILELTFNDLIKFLMNPVKYFFNSTSGIYMEEAELLEEDIYENIELDFFEKRSFFKEIILSEKLTEETLNTIKERIGDFCSLQSRRGELIDSVLSIPDIERISDTAESIVRNCINHSVLSSKPEPTTYTFGDKEELEKSILEAPLFILSSGLHIKITGSLPPLYVYPDKTVSFLNIIGSNNPSAAHWLTPYLLNKLLPGKISGNKGVSAFLVSPEKVISTQFFPGNDFSIQNLVSLFTSNLEKPIPLYPEIAELLNNKKDPGVKREEAELKSQFLEKWIERDEAELFGYSEFKSCPYRFKAYRGCPDVAGELLVLFYESVYKDLFMDLNGNKEV